MSGLPRWLSVKNPPAVQDPWVAKVPWRRAWLQRSCLENPKDRGAWWATVHGVAKSQTGLKTKSQDVSAPVLGLGE